MVHILLLILKAIGILILVLLGLVLAVVCLVLFVPVCYEAGGSWKDKPAGKGKISWLFGAVSLSAGYDGDESGLTAGVRLFGQKLWEMGEEKETPKAPWPLDEETLRGTDAERKEPKDRKKPEEKETALWEENQQPRPEPEDKRHTEHKKKDVFGRIKVFLEKLKFSFQSFCDKLKNIQNIAEEKKAWLEDEENQASLKLLWKQTGRFLRHVCPRGGKGSVTFGFEEPYLTGQVLSAAALIYPFFEGNLEICPVFDETVFEAEGSFKGRIRAGYLLWLGLGILRDGHTRRMLFGFLKGSAV
ncbi:MAG: DUF2953 domain-containing protein [Clostridium sp.]